MIGFGAEIVSAVHDVDSPGDVGQIERSATAVLPPPITATSSPL